MTPLEKRAIDLEAHRQTYWQAMRETCATIRDHRRRGFSVDMQRVHYRLLAEWFVVWREARNQQARLHQVIDRRAA